jgi:hypothetical protein
MFILPSFPKDVEGLFSGDSSFAINLRSGRIAASLHKSLISLPLYPSVLLDNDSISTSSDVSLKHKSYIKQVR